MADVFISYSRKDKKFVEDLYAALKASNRETWVDWSDIPPTADFMKEIYAGIEAADTFVFVISPDSAASKVCGMEIDHAVTWKKRLVPILRRDVNTDNLHSAVAAHNWLFFRETDNFYAAFSSLMNAIDTDLAWGRLHTRLLVRARDWESKGKDTSLLLRGNDLRDAERWLEQSVDKKPGATALHAEYIAASRRAQTRTTRSLVGGLMVGIVVAMLLAIFGFYQSNVAQRNEATAIAAQSTADRRADEAQSISWALAARDTYQRGDPFTALALALQANTSLSDSPILAQNILADVAYNARVRRHFKGHNPVGNVYSAAFSPDGRTVISGGSNGELILWDVSSGVAIQHFEGHNPVGFVTSAAFSPDGRTVISGGWKLISGGSDGELILWDVSSGAAIRRFEGHNPIGNVYSAAFSPDGRMVFSAGDNGELILWDVSSGAAIRHFQGHSGSVLSAAFSPDGRMVLSVGDNGELILWDVNSGAAIRRFEGHNPIGNVHSAAFSPDGQMVLSGGDGGELILWDVSSGAAIRRFRGHNPNGNVYSAAFSPDGRTVISGGGTVISSGDSGELILWDVSSGVAIQRFEERDPIGNVYSAAFSPDGQMVLSGGYGGEVILQDVGNGTAIRRFRGHNPNGNVYSAAFSPDGQMVLSGGYGGEVILWDVSSGAAIRRFEGHDPNESVTSVGFSPDGRTVISGGSNGELILWDVSSGAAIQRFEGQRGNVKSVAFSPDGRTVISAEDFGGELILWDVSSGAAIQRFEGQRGNVKSAAFSPDGRTVISAEDFGGELILWDVSSGSEIRRFERRSENVTSVGFSPDGRTVISAGDFGGELILWDVSSGAAIRHFQGHTGSVLGSAFSPDGRMVLSAGDNGELILWDVSSGAAIRRFEGHNPNWHVWSAAFSPDGQMVLSGGGGGELILWRLDTLSELIDWTEQNRAVPTFTCEQRVTYNVPPPCEGQGASASAIIPFPTGTIPIWTPIASSTASDTPMLSETPTNTPAIPTGTPVATASGTP